jgi:hypothetical protein
MALGCDDGRGGDDAGGITLMDSGPGGDAGPGTTDAGPGGCPPATAPMAAMPMACQASTLTCLMGATTVEAQTACVMADPNAANCDACITQDLFFTCSNPMGGGCNQQFGDIQCCLMTACPTADAACINAATAMGGACAAQTSAFFTCADAAQTARRCGITQTCFMPAGPFFPSFEARPPLESNVSPESLRFWLVSYFSRAD